MEYPFYLCHLVHQWLDFRVAELHAVAESVGVPLEIAAADEDEWASARGIVGHTSTTVPLA